MKTCFVIMPIRQAGTDEYTQYRALYDTVIRPPLVEAGFEVIRADDIAKSGAINADVIERLATSDIVVADLSDLNANVFYELGIRHTMRRNGTVLLMNASSTRLPFDLQAYRVIEFTPDLLGYEKLRTALAKIAGSEPAGTTGRSDSPVHDVLRSLPHDVYSHAEGSSEGELRERIAELQVRLNRYSEKYGLASASDETDINAISRALDQARRGELPVDLFYRARQASTEGDSVKYLEIVMQLAEAQAGVLTAEQWLTLASEALKLSLTDVQLFLNKRAVDLRPNDEGMRRIYYGTLAHSEDPRQRDLARRELGNILGITLEDGVVSVAGTMRRDQLRAAALMLDAYHRDGMDSSALEVSKALVKMFPNTTIALRNYARALGELGEMEQAFDAYELAMNAADVDDTTANWYANDLSNQGEHRRAAVVCLRGCEYDPEDPENFVRAAESFNRLSEGYARVGDDATGRSISALVVATFSCRMLNSSIVDRAQRVLDDADIDRSLIEDLMGLRQGNGLPDSDLSLLNRRARLSLVRELREVLEVGKDGTE